MEMALSSIYFPSQNPRLAGLLREDGFEYEGIEPLETPFGAVLQRSREDMVALLHPNTGTGVSYHKRETSERMRYLGLFSGGAGEAGRLAFKFQNDTEEARGSGRGDVVREYEVGAGFSTFGGTVGRWRGIHNLDKTRPVAVRILKSFS